MTTAQQIRQILSATNCTQTALAAAYGCRPASMSQFLSGKRPIPDLPRMAAALSAVTGCIVSIESLIVASDGEVREDGVTVRVLEKENN